jgi:hypothetical protein
MHVYVYNVQHISHDLRLLWDPPKSHLHDVQSMQQNGPFKSRLAMVLFRAPTTWTCHLANQRGALSHAQRAGSVYKAAVWSTRDNVLDASLSYGFKGNTIASKISTNWPGSDPAGRPLIHLRNQHDPTGSKPSTAGRPELPTGLAAEAIPVFRQTSPCPGVPWSRHRVPEFSGVFSVSPSSVD